MKQENLILKSFDIENLPDLVDVVVPLWAPSIGDEAFKRFNVEYIVRNNIWDNEYCFELLNEKKNILSAAFFARKGDFCNVEKWFSKESKRFCSDFLIASKNSKTFLSLMDEKTFSFMKEGDIKLSLFISLKPGAGSEILERSLEKLRAEGWKKLFLWTDCECNWKWYFEHGFDLVQEEIYEPFCREHEEYKTYIFSRPLQKFNLNN